MRKLMWFTLGFGASCVFWAYELGYPVVYLFVVLALAASFFLCAVTGNKNGLRCAAMVFAGFSVSCFWCQAFTGRILEPLREVDGAIAPGIITAEDYSFETGYGKAADGTIVLQGKSYSVRVYWNTEDSTEPGTCIQGTFQFRVTTPGSIYGQTSHSGKGTYLLAYQKGELAFTQGETVSFSMWAARLRQKLTEALSYCIPESACPFAKALLLGDTSDLSYAEDSHMKISGIRHVAAVSGLHVSILFALICRVSFKNRFGSAMLGFPMLFLFAALAGFTPSVCRACLMCGLMLAAMVLNREYDGLTALSASVLVMLFWNPLGITSVSLQLSAASVFGIFRFSEPIRTWLLSLLGDPKGKNLLSRVKQNAASSAATTLSAMAFTAPLCALHFGSVSLIGIAANLLTLWMISFIFYTLMIVCGVYFLNASAAVFVGKVAGILIYYVQTISGIFAAFPLACVYTVSDYVVLWLIFVYILLLIYLISAQKQPEKFIAFSLASLFLALLCSWVEPLYYDPVITVLDVGQGQCILLQSEGKTYMVDCGGEDDSIAADQAAALLLSQGVTRLDGLILTHMDRDHAGGVQNFLSRMEADLVILPPVGTDIQATNVVYADRTLKLSWGSSQITVFGGNMLESGNENSLCILLDTEKCDILITGDRNAEGEAQLIESGLIPKVDMLVAGHHGSKYATSQLLLETARPEIVCISVGQDNIYGHPAKETLQRLQNFGCEIYRTDIHGTIIIRR